MARLSIGYLLASALLGSTALSSGVVAQTQNTQSQPDQQSQQGSQSQSNQRTQQTQDQGRDQQFRAQSQDGGLQSQGRGQLTVEQRRPSVNVQQSRPEIVVRQPRPTVSIDIPPPQITIRMPRPDIDVDQRRPIVRFEAPQGQPAVQYNRADNAQVRYESNDPRVIMDRSDRQPQVRFVRPEDQGAQQQRGRAQADQQSAMDRSESAGRTRRVSVSELQDAKVVGPDGDGVGSLSNIVRDQQGRNYAVIDLDNADKTVAIDLDSLQMKGDRLILSGMRVQRVMNLPDFESQSSKFQDVRSDRSIPIVVGSADTGTASQNRQARSQQASDSDRTATRSDREGRRFSNTRTYTVNSLLDLPLYNMRGQDLGDVERIVRNAQGDLMIVIGHGGFLGLGEKQVAVPLDNVWRRGERLVIQGLTEAEIRDRPEWREQPGMTELGDEEIVRLQAEAV